MGTNLRGKQGVGIAAMRLVAVVGVLAMLVGEFGVWVPDDAAAQNRRSRRDEPAWKAIGISGGGSMFGPAISPIDSNLMMVHCDMSAAYLSTDGGNNWAMIPVAQLGANTRCKPAFHPKNKAIIFSPGGYAGRLYTSRDGGETWARIGNLPDGLRGEIAIDSERPDLMLAGVNDEIWRSTDGGQRWEKCDGPTGEAVGFAFGQLDRRGKRLAFAATKEGIWRSDDDGRRWQDVAGGLPWREIRSFTGGFDARRRKAMLYCCIPSKRENGGFAGGVMRSEDGGDSWESAMGEGINKDTQAADQWAHGDIAEYFHVLTTDAKPLTVYAFNANTGVRPPHHTAVYRSDDGGRSWRATFHPDPRFPGCNLDRNYVGVGDGQYYQAVPYGVAICATDPDVVMQVDAGCCQITRDGGRTWQNGHTRESRREGYWECTGLVVTSTWNYYIDPHDHRRHYICYTDIGFARSLDAGETWRWWTLAEKAPWRNTCYELAFDPEIPGKIWGAFSNVHDIPNGNIISGRHNANGPGGLCASTNFAETWTKIDGLPTAPCVSIAIDPKSEKGKRTLIAGFFKHGVFVSEDDGKTWQSRNTGLGHPSNMRVTRVQIHADGTWFAIITGKRNGNNWLSDGVGLYRSTDRGANWQSINRANQMLHWPKDFTVDPDDSNVIYLGAANANGERQGGLYATRDGGRNWRRIAQQGPEHFGCYIHPNKRGWLYMTLCEGAPGPGLWLSKNNGQSWEPFDDLPFANIQRVTFDPDDENKIYLTTFGGSVFTGPAEPK